MGNLFKGKSAHSAEHFGDTRDHWWNDDFIEMVARNWKLEATPTVLDVGCGVGHWGRVLARALPPKTHVVGIDREQLWVDEATRLAAGAGLTGRFSYRVGLAESLPFADETFDVVTCQTLLMHVRDPSAVLGEMVRVTRHGGLVILAEPTNVAGLLVDSIVLGDAPDITASLIQFQRTCEQGKKTLGEGDDLIGESLPKLLRSTGLERVELRQNDKVWAMVSPYDSPAEQSMVEEMIDAVDRGMWNWDRATTRRYFLAGGKGDDEFEAGWALAAAHRRRLAAAVRAGTYSSAGAGLFYLAWGWRELSIKADGLYGLVDPK
jgi:2-polyprenyl-3-methyl-5-hydroxy-6-metoxy-1,4-benzoquinol methylase